MEPKQEIGSKREQFIVILYFSQSRGKEVNVKQTE